MTEATKRGLYVVWAGAALTLFGLAAMSGYSPFADGTQSGGGQGGGGQGGGGFYSRGGGPSHK